MRSETAYISLGSNLGDRSANIQAALERLDERQIRVIKVSSLIENPAVGMPPGSPAFLNGVAALSTELSAKDLLSRLLEVEHSLGRTRGAGWTPRTIDLDLLLYGGAIINTDGLIVPHPRMHERAFVLQPLAEIAPDLVHPLLQRSISQLWQISQSV